MQHRRAHSRFRDLVERFRAAEGGAARSVRRAASMLLAGASLLVVAGCAPTAGSEHVTLQYGVWDRTQVPAMQQIVRRFEKANPRISVRISVTPWDSYWTKLRTAASSRSAPDVFWMTQDQLPLYAHGGALLPLSDRIERSGFDLSRYYPSTVKAFAFEGKEFGIPKDTNSFGLFYNKRLFAAAHLDEPDSSWTWDDLRAAARRLTDRAHGVYGVAAPVADVLGYYLTIPQAGGYVISPDRKRSGYADPDTVRGLQYWVDLIQRDHSSPTAQQMTDTDPLIMFTSGKVAMYYGGSWDPVAIAEDPAVQADTGIAPLPRGRTRTFYANGLGNVASASTKHPEEAWRFLEFLGSEEAASIQARTGTVIPAYRGLEDEYATSMPGLDLRALVDQLPNAQPIPASLDTAVWSDHALQEFTDAWVGRQSVEQAGRKAADFMDAALAKEQR